ncbi:MAG TPA: hypothetical protein VMF08_21575 [Candidatus Sulfotelmatobacter sp.]|nr:hypothetical protein [Candidatus Sulfotelmatobacter sp.]
MDYAQRFIIFAFCVPGAAFFTSFALTFGPGKIRFAAAAIFYSIGMMFCMGFPAYFHFFRGSDPRFGWFPMLESLSPIFLLCFGIAAVVLLWPSIPQQTAMRLAMLLFFVICPILIIIRVLPEFLQFEHRISSDLTSWLLYAVLWFRVRDGYASGRGP